MKRYFMLLICCCLLSFTSGCDIKKEKVVAEAVVARLFIKVQAGDFESAMSLYSRKFFRRTPKDDWKSTLGNIHDKLGSLQNYELVNWNIRTQINTFGCGTYCVMQYKVKYSMHPANETITMFKPIGSKFQIRGHNINSVGLMKE